MSNACPSEIPSLAQYLIDCVNGDHAHVKLKALFVIKTLAYRRLLELLAAICNVPPLPHVHVFSERLMSSRSVPFFVALLPGFRHFSKPSSVSLMGWNQSKRLASLLARRRPCSVMFPGSECGNRCQKAETAARKCSRHVGRHMFSAEDMSH